MATTGEWRDGLSCLKLTFASLDRADRFQRSFVYMPYKWVPVQYHWILDESVQYFGDPKG